VNRPGDLLSAQKPLAHARGSVSAVNDTIETEPRP